MKGRMYSVEQLSADWGALKFYRVDPYSVLAVFAGEPLKRYESVRRCSNEVRGAIIKSGLAYLDEKDDRYKAKQKMKRKLEVLLLSSEGV